MSTDADFTLADLWERGVPDLQSEDPSPGTTYEVAPGLIGTMPWPTLQKRERGQEIRSELQDLFREDAEADDFRALQEAAEKGESLDRSQNPIREGVTTQEYTQTTARVNCKLTAFLLDFEEEVEPSDIVPDMAAVVSVHFTKLRAGQNGQQTS